MENWILMFSACKLYHFVKLFFSFRWWTDPPPPYEAVSAAVAANGSTHITFTPLVDWLCAVCTCITINKASLEAMPLAHHLQWHHLPMLIFCTTDGTSGLWPSHLDSAQIQCGAQHMTMTIGQLATKQHIMWEEVAQAHADHKNHTMKSHFCLNT